MKLILNPEYNLYEKEGQAFCDSLQIAETFDKRHADVLRDIEKVIGSKSGLSKEFRERNFAFSSYKSEQNKTMPKYLLTKDGFTIITFGYGGVKAMRFKEAYINRFNQMEQFIKSLFATKIEFPAFTEAVMLAHDEPKHYHYSNEINMIYRIVLGMDAKKFREQNNIEPGAVIKPFLTLDQIKAVETLQRVDIGLLEIESDYHKRQEILKNKYYKMIKLLTA